MIPRFRRGVKSTNDSLNRAATDKWTGVVVVGLITSAIFFGVVKLLSGSEPPPVLDQIRAQVPRSASVAALTRADLRGPGLTSYVVVIRPKRLHWPFSRRQPPVGVSGSDRMRIYDIEGDRAHLAADIGPAPSQPKPPQIRWKGLTWGNDEPRRFRFALDGIRDRDGDGRPEVLGQFSDQINYTPRPFIVVAGDSGDSYVLSPLVARAPTAPVYDSGPIDLPQWPRREARTPLRLALVQRGRGVVTRLYGARRFRLVRQGPQLILLTAFAATGGSQVTTLSGGGSGSRGGSTLTLESTLAMRSVPTIKKVSVEAALVRLDGGRAETRPCSIYASSRISRDLTVSRWVVGDVGPRTLDPRRLDLARHVDCL